MCLSLPLLVHDVLVFVPLLVSTANTPSLALALAGLVWKPLLSPALLVTRALVVGLSRPVLLGPLSVRGAGGVRVGRIAAGVAGPDAIAIAGTRRSGRYRGACGFGSGRGDLREAAAARTRQRSILKLVSSLALSVQARLIWLLDAAVAVRLLGAAGGGVGAHCRAAHDDREWLRPVRHVCAGNLHRPCAGGGRLNIDILYVVDRISSAASL